jgi:RNA-binding protein
VSVARSLTEKQKKHLRGLGHGLHALVTLGDKGLTEAIVAELELALLAHELVKVRARLGDRAARDAAFAALAERTASTLIARVGHVGLYFRPHPSASRVVLPSG